MPGSEQFGDLLFSLIRARGWTQSDFAKKVGKKPGVIQFIRQGKRTPPPASIEEWADLLNLTGDERDRFVWTAAVAHVPRAVQPGLLRLIDRHIKLHGDYRRLLEEARKRR